MLDGTALRRVIANFSGIGAKLTMIGRAELPASFRLQASDLGLDVVAKLVWRAGEEAGVRFRGADGCAAIGGEYLAS